MGSFDFTTNKISTWKSTGIFNRSSNSKYHASSNMDAVGDSSGNLPNLKNDGRMNVYLSGNHFQQNKVIIPNNNNAINIYCVYKLDPLSSTRDKSYTIQNALFGAMQITKDATDYDKNDYMQIYAEKNFYRNFTGFGKKFVLSLHYNGDDS